MSRFKGEKLPIPYPLTPIRKARLKQLENRLWVDNNIETLMKEYAGKILIVKDKQIVEVEEVYEKAREVLDRKAYDWNEVCVIGLPPPGFQMTVLFPEFWNHSKQTK